MTTNPSSSGIDPNALAQALIGLAQQGGTTAFKAVSSTPRSSGYAHGNGGLMSAPGMSREIINAAMAPYGGLASRLPSLPSSEDFPLYGIVTGQTTGSGSNPTGVCDDFPVAGLLKLCSQSYTFGRYGLQTPVIDITRVGRTTNRAEFYDYQMIGSPLDSTGTLLTGPTPPAPVSLQDALNNEVAKVMFELAFDWTRRYGPMLYTGNPVNNTSGGGYKEFRGLDGLINTGYRDADTGIACTAADSIIANFASANVSTTSTNIVALLTSIYRRQKLKARNTGLWPVKWVFVMRETLFYELTQIWACVYATYRCGTLGGFSASQPNTTNAETVMQLRQQMRGNQETRTGQYLLIDDEPVEVVFDEFITETALANGAFNSSIYLVPLTVKGGRRVTYFEFFPYQDALAAARVLAPADSYFTTDGNRYIWHKEPPTNACVRSKVWTEPRLIFRAPHLAARLTNVAYSPLQHEDDWLPTGYYFKDGGKTDRLGYSPSFFSPNTNIS